MHCVPLYTHTHLYWFNAANTTICCRMLSCSFPSLFIFVSASFTFTLASTVFLFFLFWSRALVLVEQLIGLADRAGEGTPGLPNVFWLLDWEPGWPRHDAGCSVADRLLGCHRPCNCLRDWLVGSSCLLLNEWAVGWLESLRRVTFADLNAHGSGGQRGGECLSALLDEWVNRWPC